MRISLLLILSLGWLSCSRQAGTIQAVRVCVESKTDELFRSVYGEKTKMGIYQMAILVENEFKKEGFLANSTKEQYLKLFDYIHTSKGAVFFDNELIREYSSISGLAITPIVVDCPYTVVVQEENELNSSIVMQLKNASVLQHTGYSSASVESFIRGISDKDFAHIEFRAPVIVIFLFHLEEFFRAMN